MKKIKAHITPLNFLGSTVFLYGITLAVSFVTYRYVAPDFLGIWATFSTFTTITTFARLGIVNGMNRELPYYLGKGEYEKAQLITSTTLCYTLLNMALMLILGVLFFFLFDFDAHNEFSNAYRYAALVFFITIILEPYQSYLSGTFRTSDNFDKLSKTQYYMGIYRLLSISLVLLWSYNGYLIRELGAVALNTMLLHYYRPMKGVKIKFNTSCFVQLFTIGISIFLSSYISTFVDTLPRLYIISEGSSRELGLFSPVLIILGIVSLIPNTISSYLYPKFSYSYGQGCSPIYFWDSMKKVLLGSLVLGVAAFLVVFLFIDDIIGLFPKYIESAPYIKIACFAMMFVGYKLCNMICVIMKQYKWIWVQPLLYILFQTGSLFILNYTISDTLAIASYSLVFSNMLLFVASTSILYYLTHHKK